MDLRAYYKKVREVESTITAPFVVVVGVETPEGGKDGTQAETSKQVAAKLVAEGRARLATPEETEAFYKAQLQAREEAEALAATQRMQVTFVPNPGFRTGLSKGSKE